jgi:hypothetical protein
MSYAYVFHWKEQVLRYANLELESFPPKKKPHKLQSLVSDYKELTSVKHIGEQYSLIVDIVIFKIQ